MLPFTASLKPRHRDRLSMYLKQIRINGREFPSRQRFPFNIPAFRKTEQIDISSRVTFFVGENGSGKSALLDAIARKSGLLPWGGSKIHRVHENPYETQLANHIELTFEPRHRYGFHFRAEVFFNFAASLDDIILDDPGRDKYLRRGIIECPLPRGSVPGFFQRLQFPTRRVIPSR